MGVEAAVRRRLRRAGGKLIRQLHLLPGGEPDGLGDDAALLGGRVDFSVMVYFPDPPPNLYQLRQWYRTLMALDRKHPVGIVCLDSRSAATIRMETTLPVVCCARIGTLEDLVSRSDVALAMYVNHNIRNLHPLRFPTMLHAYLGHGESDKASSASNQVKAYDAVLVPGPAGRERLARNLLVYDAAAHVYLVGRPQLDDDGGSAPATAPAPAPAPGTTPRRPVILYAPTWEGAQPSMAYSSVVSHGPALLTSLLGSKQYDVVYRPHPRTGANAGRYAAADQQLRQLIREAGAADPAARHHVDLTPARALRSDPADLLISDVSAMAADWLTTGKPILVTVPASEAAVVDPESVLSVVSGITAADASRTAELVAAELHQSAPPERAAWVARAMGDVTPGAATTRFLDVCGELIARRNTELAARAQRLAGAIR